MKLRNLNAQTQTAAEIVEDKSVGFYLYIYNQSGQCVADHLQDSLQIAKEQAEEEYGMANEEWQLIG